MRGTKKLFYKQIPAWKVLVELFYKKNSPTTILPVHSHLLRRITRILNVRLKQLLGAYKFHYFLYGRKFILQTDQKPLIYIFRKHMISISPRIQRITIWAWQYEFEPQHIPDRNNVISNALSRVTPLELHDSNAEKDILAITFYSILQSKKRRQMRCFKKPQWYRTPIIKTCNFYRMANEEKPDSSFSASLLEF